MSQRVLAADDESGILRLLEINLRKAGYTVETAVDGREALEKIIAAPPDLVLLDVMMPHMDGFEVLRRLREDPATTALPIVMLTARAQDADVFHGLKSGATSYLTKPFNPSEMLALVRHLLDSATGE